jgi:hypothetical protein
MLFAAEVEWEDRRKNNLYDGANALTQRREQRMDDGYYV